MNSNTHTRHISHEYVRFFGFFFLIFFATAVLLYVVDFVPEAPNEEVESTAQSLNASLEGSVASIENPTRVSIPSIGVNTVIGNPASSDINDLDNALLGGAVRYPGSAQLGEDAPIFLFGHQSYLPVVRNKAFKAFNGLQNLTEGDTIDIFSDTTKHQYRVQKVSLVEANEALIPLDAGSKTLVLSTCNSFGDPGERYLVTAEYVGHKEGHSL